MNTKKRFTQMFVVAFFAIVLSFVYAQYDNFANANVKLNENIKFVTVYGVNPDSVSSFDRGSINITTLNEKANVDKSYFIRGSLIGETIDFDDETLFLEHFEYSKVFDLDGNVKQYRNTMKGTSKNNIVNNRINVLQTRVSDNVYYSLTNVKVESTINYQMDGTVLSVVKDGKRYDEYIEGKYSYASYDKENDEFYLFFVSSGGEKELPRAVIGYKKIVYSAESDEYTTIERPVSLNVYGEIGSLSYTTDVKDGEIKIVFYDHQTEGTNKNYVIKVINYDTVSNESQVKTVSRQTVKDDKKVSINTVLEFNNDLNIMYGHNLKYTTVNLKNLKSVDYNILGTGSVSKMRYSHDLENIFMLAENGNNMIVYEIDQGNVISTQKFKKTDFWLGIGPISLRDLYDFIVIYEK